MNRCSECGQPISFGHTRCDSCYLRGRSEYKPGVTDDDYEEFVTEQPAAEWCVMCGQEYFTRIRSDGRFYCATCWAIWNG